MDKAASFAVTACSPHAAPIGIRHAGVIWIFFGAIDVPFESRGCRHLEHCE